MSNGQANPNAKVETPIGPIFIEAKGLKTALVSSPQLMIDGLAMSVSAFLVSSNGLDFDFIQEATKEEDGNYRFRTARYALQGRLANGQDVDLIILGKLAAIIGPAVREFAANNRRFFLEAERQELGNIAELLGNIAELGAKIRHDQERVVEKRRQLAAIESQMTPPSSPASDNPLACWF
jgi:hypothetical protein